MGATTPTLKPQLTEKMEDIEKFDRDRLDVESFIIRLRLKFQYNWDRHTTK